MPSKLSQSEISPVLPDATAPPVTQTESACALAGRTVTVPTAMIVASNTAKMVMVLIKLFPL